MKVIHNHSVIDRILDARDLARTENKVITRIDLTTEEISRLYDEKNHYLYMQAVCIAA